MTGPKCKQFASCWESAMDAVQSERCPKKDKPDQWLAWKGEVEEEPTYNPACFACDSVSWDRVVTRFTALFVGWLANDTAAPVRLPWYQGQRGGSLLMLRCDSGVRTRSFKGVPVQAWVDLIDSIPARLHEGDEEPSSSNDGFTVDNMILSFRGDGAWLGARLKWLLEECEEIAMRACHEHARLEHMDTIEVPLCVLQGIVADERAMKELVFEPLLKARRWPSLSEAMQTRLESLTATVAPQTCHSRVSRRCDK